MYKEYDIIRDISYVKVFDIIERYISYVRYMISFRVVSCVRNMI